MHKLLPLSLLLVSGCTALPDPDMDIKASLEDRVAATEDGQHKIALFSCGGFKSNRWTTVGRLVRQDSENDMLHFTQDRTHYREHFDNIIHMYNMGYDIVIGGHSLGCQEAILTARFADTYDIPVMLVLLDSMQQHTGCPLFHRDRKIPDNVYYVMNCYSELGPFEGGPFPASDLTSGETVVSNIKYMKAGHMDFIDEHIVKDIADDIDCAVDCMRTHNDISFYRPRNHSLEIIPDPSGL